MATPGLVPGTLPAPSFLLPALKAGPVSAPAATPKEASVTPGCRQRPLGHSAQHTVGTHLCAHLAKLHSHGTQTRIILRRVVERHRRGNRLREGQWPGQGHTEGQAGILTRPDLSAQPSASPGGPAVLPRSRVGVTPTPRSLWVSVESSIYPGYLLCQALGRVCGTSQLGTSQYLVTIIIPVVLSAFYDFLK